MHLVTTEQDKCTKFEDGLRLEVKKGISTRDMQTFGDLREAALRVERLVEEEMSMTVGEQGLSKSTGKRKGNFSTTFGTPKGRSTGFRGGSSSRGGHTRQTSTASKPRCDVYGKKHDGECWHWDREQTVTQKPQCPHCEKRHEGECRYLTGACFECGEMGHRAWQCPQWADHREVEAA